MKKQIPLLFLLISCFASSCGGSGQTTPREPTSYEKFLQTAAENGFEVEFKRDDMVYNFTYKEETLSIKTFSSDPESVSEYSAQLTDEFVTYPIDRRVIAEYKEKGWIDYGIHATKAANGHYYADYFEFEILNKEMCPIIEVPDRHDCIIRGYIAGITLDFSIDCKIDYTRYFDNYDKAKMLNELIEKWELSNRNIAFDLESFLFEGEFRVNRLKDTLYYSDVNVTVTNLTYLERDAVKHEISYVYTDPRGRQAIYNDVIVFDKETKANLYFESKILSTEYIYIFSLDKYSIGSRNSNKLD